MRIAHLSDPHILDLEGVERSRLLWNKRLTGMVNIKLHRGSVHKRQVVEAMVEDLRAQRIDHVVITGDITNLALETEFDRARSVFRALGIDPSNVSVIPGNHDVYTRGAESDQRFAKFFAEHITSDLPFNDASNHPSGPFPFVRLRGDVAIIGLSTAVARLPLIASGRAGDRQLEALASILDHPELATRTPVVLVHHPLINPPGYIGTATHGLPEASRIREILSRRKETIVLHGHLHDRAHRIVEFEIGAVMHHFGATSASLLHDSPDRIAGYNVYDISGEGLQAASARVYDPGVGVFVDAGIRKRSAAYAT